MASSNGLDPKHRSRALTEGPARVRDDLARLRSWEREARPTRGDTSPIHPGNVPAA